MDLEFNNDDPCFPTDSETARHDDPGLHLDTAPVSHDDPRSPTDTAPVSLDDPCLHSDSALDLNDEPGLLSDTAPILDNNPGTSSSSRRFSQDNQNNSSQTRCVNCNLNITYLRRHTLEIDAARSIVQQWVFPVQVSHHSQVCHNCWTNVWERIRNPTQPNIRPVHRRVCVNCGCSLMRIRCHTFSTATAREQHIRNVIAQWISPRQLRLTDHLCHPCWQRSDRATLVSTGRSRVINVETQRDTLQSPGEEHSEPELPPETVPTITLPNFTRAADTQRRCFFPSCNGVERIAIPKSLRVRLLSDVNFYVPVNCRICHFHLMSNSWHLLSDIENPINSFNAAQIEDFALLLKANVETYLDFNNINQIPDHLVHYWLGLSKLHFRALLGEVPRLMNKHRGEFALAAYLLKLRTGDSNERIASLLQVPRSILERLMEMARELLAQDFVTKYLGINNITRAEIANRNLIIPKGLFGGAENNPIVIADGTYIYVQKSSNYLYQKQTYSLHKYRNLIKPFLICCTDGYIVDVLGPYPATTSDSDILTREFRENTIYRQFFQQGDVFILDRGFRNALPLMQESGYRVYVPSSLEEGETQLSTIEANKTRTVTICRWVVEAVNGIFKQEFKIFRQSFFNRASKHVMIDFSIAASLINKFHLRVTDRDDAVQILNIINERLHMPNDLADFVVERQMNRLRANFQNINVNVNIPEFPRLTYNDLILISCGTYQIKQARSYYGEHIRLNGTYSVEICRDRDNNLLEGLPAANCTLIRGKIQSRHTSRKIYFIYILIKNNEQGRNAIMQYYCNCLAGRRTVGCCAHIMTIIWYLGWARHERNISAPASFLDHILVYDDDF